MKILLCSTTDLSGGAARAAYRLLNGLKQANADTRMLVSNKQSSDNSVLKVADYYDKEYFAKRLFSKLLLIVLRNMRNRKWAQYPNRDNVLFSDIVFSGLKNSLSKICFDLLHLHWVEGDFINYKDLGNLSKPIVWTLHGCFPFTGICHYFENCLKYKTRCGNCPKLKSGIEKDLSTEMFLLKQKRYKSLNLHVVSPSKWLAEKAQESELLGDRPISVIPNGIDANIFSPVIKEIARKALNIDENKRIILFGGFSPISDKRKGFSYFQSAIKILKEQYRFNDVEILIFGAAFPDPNYVPYYKTTYLDYISNDRLLVIVYSAADVMVVPSKYDNLPNTIMESLACATPVTAFDIGGNPDMLDHKKNGYLAKPYDAKDLAYGIKWCLEKNNDNSLSTSARQKVLDRFSLETISTRYIALYESLLR